MCKLKVLGRTVIGTIGWFVYLGHWLLISNLEISVILYNVHTFVEVEDLKNSMTATIYNDIRIISLMYVI